MYDLSIELKAETQQIGPKKKARLNHMLLMRNLGQKHEESYTIPTQIKIKLKRLINIRGLQSKPIARGKSLLCNKWSIYYGQLGTLNIHADPLEKGVAPTPVFFPGEFHGQRSLASYHP